MNANDPAQRLRGPPSGASPAINIAATTVLPRTPGTQLSRAEKFEDEKRRIMESCFGKKDIDGTILESYITHIRIVEDATHPSSPPPTQSPPENKKPRVIVIAVKKSGRVRMHKARENANGSFSIGKTWVLDDLTMIQSYVNGVPSTPEEQQNKERAGGTGFVIHIQKPYYWQASSPKEKDFFIYSLIKIFKKYTGGRLPELHGFDPQELEVLSGPTGPFAIRVPQTPSPSTSTESGAFPSGSSFANGTRPPIPQQAERSRVTGADTRSRPSQEYSSRERVREPQDHPSQDRFPQEGPSQERLPPKRSSQERLLRTTASDDRMPHIPGQYPSSEFVRSLNPQPLQQPKHKRSDSPGDSSTPPSTIPESNLRKKAGINSNESSRNRQERELVKVPVNELQGEERLRQNGTFDTSSSVSSAASPDSRMLPSALRSGPPETWQVPPGQKREREPSIGASQPNSGEITSDTNFDSDGLHPGIIAETSRDNSNDNSKDMSIMGNLDDQDDRATRIHTPKAHQRKDGGISSDVPGNNSDRAVIPAATDDVPSASAIKTDPASTDVSFSSPADSDVPSAAPLEAESHRPGLGPMIKKKSNKELASTFRKAATAYSAFKPRAGGAVEKLRNESERSASENDGVSGVFPAPSIAKETSRDSGYQPKSEHSGDSQPLYPELKKEVLAVNIGTSPEISTNLVDVKETGPEKVVPEKTLSNTKNLPEERRKKRRSDHSTKYAGILGINHSLLEGRTFEIESVLSDFGWSEERSGVSERSTFEQLQSGLQSEISRVEAGSWLGPLENNDERVTAVGGMMDRIIAECEELDCLLTLYNVELGTLSEDVAYIEAQSQGLQVQTANQKLLHTELKTLLDTISISSSDLRALKDASLNKPQGLQAIETTLSQLYTAMLTIDPNLRQQGTRPNTSDQASVDRSSVAGFGGSELSSMRAVREKKDGYRNESADFIQRLREYMSVKFREVEAQTVDKLEQRKDENAASNLTRLDHRLREKPKGALWVYSPLMLFTREIEPSEWENFMRMYENSAKKPYQEEFKDNIFAWKCKTRKPFGDEDILFTAQEKESDSIVGRKLTHKRSKTVRYEGSSRTSTGEKPKDGKVNAHEAFAGTLSEMARMILVEQNFLVDLFHISSLETSDFLDALAMAPESRKGGDPMEKRLADPDRNMAKRVLSIMEEVYSSWPAELQSLADWVIKQDTLQGVGVLLSLELQLCELEDTNQEFLTQTITRVHDRLATLFSRFLDEQIRGIEDTKVKIKKRKGVISFMKTFPNFCFALENMLPPIRNLPNPAIRILVNNAYQNINKAMFESLKFIAKETPTTGSTSHSQNPISSGVAGDPEDKEALNYHILLIENMNHYIEEVNPRDNPILGEWRARATREMEQHMHLYISAITRRPLGKLLDFLESTESLLTNDPSPIPAAAIAARASHSRSTFRKLLAQYDGREIRRGIETLRKRVEKHFGDADEAELSRGLVVKVLKACEGVYLEVEERVGRVIKEVYEGLELEWRREDVVGGLRR